MDKPDSLAARLQHDARTPLNAILGMVELLEGTLLNADQQKYVSVLRRSTETLLTLVDRLPAEGSDSQPASADLNGLRILLVDDSEDNRFLVVRYLRGTGAVVDEASDGKQALDCASVKEYDVILMDVEMPVMDGLTATRALRAKENESGRRRARVIALTAHDASEVISQTQAAGCDDLITKPVRRAVLVNALARPQTSVPDLVPGYLAKRRAEIPVLRTAVESGNLAAVQAIGHKLAGTGAGYGLPRVSTIGAALERAAKANETTTARGLVEALAEAVGG